MLPLRRNVPTKPRQEIGSSDEKVIFVVIVEVEQIAGVIVPRERPTIALCDVASTTSWVSSKFVDEIEATGFSLTNQTSRRKEGRPPRIHIRWSCDTLGQTHEEGTFFIEPKAQFKISFGCAYRINHLPTKSHQPRHSTRRKGKQVDQESHIRDEAVESFRQGIEAEIILPLERMTPVTEDQQPRIPIVNVEAELHHAWQSYSYTDQALSTSNDEETSSYCPSSLYGDFSARDIASTRGSETDNDNGHIHQSANTSVSGSSYQSSSWADQPALGGWMSQPLYEEPQRWVVPRIMQPERRPLSFQRCRDLTPRGQAKLAAARAASEKEAAEYWQWDEEAQKYKHYDEGCSEPVWYNPP
ncbi:uncharacterized protein PAC_10425 [Phialocephala subalpina]|uniref:Uncharacterized protein n=1 Tax=Phialocephala subalpina TaxID=576137 RepID=A0A1L7X677_9HELO|nr:uncharacterized protein PAC_10425 [Phialocephala subalpina]